MKLERSTYVKIALIVLLCLGVCGFFGGCGRGVGHRVPFSRTAWRRPRRYRTRPRLPQERSAQETPPRTPLCSVASATSPYLPVSASAGGIPAG